MTSTSNGLLNSTINIADMGQSPQDGFSESGLPRPTRPRWGDYSWGIFLPGSGGRIYFANEYIQYPNCTGAAFTLTIGTCAGPGMETRTGERRSTTWFRSSAQQPVRVLGGAALAAPPSLAARSAR